MQQSDVRAVLDYVPAFKGKVFVVVLGDGLLPAAAVAETLLDLKSLQEIGVKLVIGVQGRQITEFVDHATETELKLTRLKLGLSDGKVTDRVLEILERGQAAVIDCEEREIFDQDLVELGVSLKAAKYLTLLNGAGVLYQKNPLPAIQLSEVEYFTNLVDEGADLLQQSAVVCAAGIPRVHLLDGRKQGVLIDEIFSNEGVGTMVHVDHYQEVRPLREEDIPELLAMIGRSVRQSHLVPRAYEEIREKISDYLVMTLDFNVVGCIAIHKYQEHDAELACLYVKQSHENLGYGQFLVKRAEEWAKERGVKCLFALTNRAESFFRDQLGYKPMTMDEMPVERRLKLEESHRESVAVCKIL